jgi:hypothetical protein
MALRRKFGSKVEKVLRTGEDAIVWKFTKRYGRDNPSYVMTIQWHERLRNGASIPGATNDSFSRLYRPHTGCRAHKDICRMGADLFL